MKNTTSTYLSVNLLKFHKVVFSSNSNFNSTETDPKFEGTIFEYGVTFLHMMAPNGLFSDCLITFVELFNLFEYFLSAFYDFLTIS